MRFSPEHIRKATIVVAVGSGISLVAYAVVSTQRTVARVVYSSAIDREKRLPEYIYVDDPVLKLYKDGQDKKTLGSLRSPLMWRLLWVCRHGDHDQRNVALRQLAAIDKSNDWEYYKIAQALDADTAVLLARTEGADQRYFLQPPMYIRRLAGPSSYRFGRLRQMMLDLRQQTRRHSCTDGFINKYFTSVKELTSQDNESKPDTPDERRLCLLTLEAVGHHLSLADPDDEVAKPAHAQVLSMVAEILVIHRDDVEMQMSALKVLSELSGRPDLLRHFYTNGLLGYLARWIRSADVRFSCIAAASLANLAREGQYRGGLCLLHPIYRRPEKTYCDVLFLHGLRGGVFVTWRQRDNKDENPVGILATVLTSSEEESCEMFSTKSTAPYVADPDMRQMITDLEDMEEDALLADYEVVVQDLPEYTLRDTGMEPYTQLLKRESLLKELEDRCGHTALWPKDWLPKDCEHLRVLGLDYGTKMTEWTSYCGADSGLEERARVLRVLLRRAGVGHVPLVAVAHSMGGLVVERALLDSAASDQEAERRLARCTRALVYYSTPHRGSSLANLRRGTAAVLWPSVIVQQLQEGSPMLLQLQRDFVQAAQRFGWETVSFGESRPTLVSPFKVPIQFVQDDSADLGRGPFYRVPLDHVSVCKPATRQSLLYLSLVDILRRVVREEGERRRQRIARIERNMARRRRKLFDNAI